MKKELSIKQIYDDFINKVSLSDNEIDVLKRYIKNDSIVKISTDTLQSERTVSRIISDLKEKYYNYKQIELTRLNLLKNWQNYDKE